MSTISHKRFYSGITLLLMLGLGWIAYQLYTHNTWSIVACPFKRVTHYPCPACNSTTAVLQILDGYIWVGIQTNPLSIFLIGGIIISIVMGIYDIIFQKTSLYNLYQKLENTTKKSAYVKWALFLFFILIWINNILQQV